MKRSLALSAALAPLPHGIDLAAPGGIDALIAFHRGAFGDATMSVDTSTTPPPATPPAALPPPTVPTPTATPTPAAGDKGFPEGTPIAEMSDAQQAAYWKFQSRKHEERAEGRADYDTVKQRSAQLEDELNAVRQAQMSESEKALADARKAGADEARAAATAEFADRDRARGIKLVDGFLDLAMGAGGRLDRDRVTPILDALDKSRYLTAEGDVDTEGLGKLVDSLAGPATPTPPATPKWPGMGQGRQEAPPVASGMAAGAAEFARRHPAGKTS